TGGEQMSARFMRQDPFNFIPNLKLWIAGNNEPELRSVGEAMKRRFRIIPFPVKIAEEKKDPDLLVKLRAEAPGILRWGIEGCLKWQREGLTAPASITKATGDYIESQDHWSAWLGECCEMDVDAWASSTMLFVSWTQWAR